MAAWAVYNAPDMFQYLDLGGREAFLSSKKNVLSPGGAVAAVAAAMIVAAASVWLL